MNEPSRGETGEPSGGIFGSLVGAAILDDPSLGVFQRVLLTTDGTIVRLLEGCFGEPVRTAELVQFRTPASATDGALEPAGHETILRRKVLLQGSRTGRNYVYADSFTVLDRVGSSLREALLSTSEPIGRLLVSNRVETFREILRVGRRRAGALGGWFGLEFSDELLFRNYRLISGGRPIMLIAESFPPYDFSGQRDGQPAETVGLDREPGDVTETNPCR